MLIEHQTSTPPRDQHTHAFAPCALCGDPGHFVRDCPVSDFPKVIPRIMHQPFAGGAGLLNRRSWTSSVGAAGSHIDQLEMQGMLECCHHLLHTHAAGMRAASILPSSGVTIFIGLALACPCVCSSLPWLRNASFSQPMTPSTPLSEAEQIEPQRSPRSTTQKT